MVRQWRAEVLKGERRSMSVWRQTVVSLLPFLAWSAWGWAESLPPEVIFQVEPGSARIYYQTTTVSSGEQEVLLGHGTPGRPLRLKEEFFRPARDSYRLIFRDPDGNFKEASRVFGKFELHEGQTVSVVLEPSNWKGHLIRYPWVPVAILSLGGGGLFWWRRSVKSGRMVEEMKSAVEESIGEDSLIGLKLDGYQVVGLLGHGAVGKVYRAESNDKRPGVVAIKFMEPDVSGMGGVDKERMLREAEIHLRLEHPSILKCYKTGLYKSFVYMILAFVPGGKTIKSWIAPGGTSAEKVVAAMKPVFEALQYAHEQGVVHRDLKPENILISSSDAPLVADFGMAKDQDSALTQTNATLGTILYMPPEQFGGSRHAVSQSDQYAVGVILYELLTGQPPFRGESFVELYLAHTQNEAPGLPDRPDLNRDLDRVLQRMLSKSVEKRFPDMLCCYAELLKAVGLSQRGA